MEGDNPPQQPSPLPPTYLYPEHSYTTIPLNTPATEIRLLELYPSADFSSPLYCRLYNTPIASPAPFKALSYAWGSDDKTHLIYVESNSTTCMWCGAMSGGHGEERGESDVGGSGTTRSTIGITSSLDSCLRHLRAIHHRDHLSHNNSHPPPNPHHHMSPPVPPLTLWIDQLCINQSDSDEKAVQVGLMTQIYSRAKQVLIWLGPAADGSDEVMDALAEFGRKFESVRRKGLNVFKSLLKVMVDAWMGVFDEESGGEKRKVGIGAKEEKKIDVGEEIKGGIGAREGSGTTCGGDEIVDIPVEGGGDGNAAAGNHVEAGCRVDLGVGVYVADTETLEGAAAVCTRKKASASTVKTVMAVVEDGAAKLLRLGVSDELQAFFRRPWFTRLWVVQEACHCADTVLVCGTKPPVSYDILGSIAVCAFHIVREFRKGDYMPEWGGVNDPPCGCSHADMAELMVSAMTDVTSYTYQLYQTRYTTIQQISKGEGGSNLSTLLVQIYNSGNLCRETKLYRDRVYALLGLAADADELDIKPDYSSRTSTSQILTGVAKAIIGKTKEKFPVELLSYSQFPKTILDDGSDEQLPSWVPDWRSGLRDPFYHTLSDTDMFMACGPHHSVDMVPTITAGMLGLRGYLVDTIEEVVRTSTGNRCRESIEFFEKWDKLWELSKQKNKPIYATPARREEALWRVPIGDSPRCWQKDTLRKRAKAGFALEYHKLRHTLEDEKKKDAFTERALDESDADEGYYYCNAMGYMIRMRLYLTKEGYMGMGPSNMQPGDVVVVFPGARIPFVLRPTGEDNTFTYLGHAYCDGIMDGEITLREERRDFFLV